MNHVGLIGRLTAAPMLRETASGDPMAILRLAVPRGGSDGAVFVDVVCFDRQAEAAAEHLATGRRVAVGGRLDQREWRGADGLRRERHAVVADRIEFLDAASRRTRARG